MAVIRQERTDVAQPQAYVIGAIIPRQEQPTEARERGVAQQIPDAGVDG